MSCKPSVNANHRRRLARSPLSLAIGLCLAPLAGQSMAQEVAAGADEPVLQTVISVGNRGTQRTVADSPVPVDVLDARALEKQGASALRDVLSNLLPSFHVAKVTGGAYSNVARSAGLRGLGGGYVLVLVNGKRRHANAVSSEGSGLQEGWNAADLDSIPMAAVDRVEVLRDGAAAQYGSDAVAGVINIILKSDSSGGSATTTAGRRSHYASGVGSNGETYQQSLNYGLGLPNEGFLNLTLDWKNQDSTKRSAPATGSFYYPVNGQPDPRENTVERRSYGGGLPEIEQLNLSYNAELPLSDDLRLYSFSTYTKQDALVSIGFRRPNSNTVLTELYPDGIAPDFEFDTRDFHTTWGIKGEELAGWNWDLSTTYGENTQRMDSSNNLNPSLGPDSPTEFYLQNNELSQWVTNLDFNRHVDIGLANPLNFATGLEYREDHYVTESGDEASYVNGRYVFPVGHPRAGQEAAIGALGNYLLLPEDEANLRRSTSAAYVDLGLDVTDKWYVGAAGRYERYTDSAGSTWNGKLATRYAFTPAFAVRGAINTGFVAPSLTQQGYAKTGLGRRTVGNETVDIMIKRVQADSAIGRALGAEELTPVKSTSYSLGLTWTPITDLNLAADAYVIDLEDRIALISPLQGAAVDAILDANGFGHVQQVQYYANAFDTRTKGLDLVADYTQRLARYGRLRWTVAANWNDTRITDMAPNPAQLQGLGLSRFQRTEIGSVTDSKPRSKYILGVNWQVGDFDIGLRNTRYGKVKLLGTGTTVDQEFSAKWITDVDATYSLTDNVRVTLGAENLFDVYPDKHTVNDVSGGSYYSTISPFGSYGAYYYTRLSIDF
ncbi:iron complex outermembrane recepter protein [Pseudomonas flavescens]|uniref:Iron complex outermembrane recepter protein n=1 Tax=Phytopseudomonas flavescens TaxID=29435 RepID=A0A1G7XU21_9GAMM|nr:TonB-dependent receptor [Pseudomonas flavescens]SDG87702.1 iron complex outermembrane recepter protein [Pseudomonas flavescens]